MRILQSLYIILFFAVGYIPLLSFIPLVNAMGYFLLSFFLLLMIHILLKSQNHSPKIWGWLTSRQHKISYYLLFILLLFSYALSLWITPKNGLLLHFQSEDASQEINFPFQTSRFDIQPANFINHKINQDGTLILKGYFYSPYPMVRAMFHVGHGEAVWKLDGEIIAEHLEFAPNRYLRIETPLPEGFHHIECKVDYQTPIPPISMSLQNTQKMTHSTLKGPFFYGFYPTTWTLHPFYKFFPPFLLLCSLILLIPLMNSWITSSAHFFHKYWRPAYSFCSLIVFIIFFFFLRSTFIVPTLSQYEADEAAFGLMAQNLNQGQSPPLFHYGQQYQGIAEVFPLSWIENQIEDPALSLNVLPFLWGILFIVFTITAYYLVGSLNMALFASFFLLLGGTHFHWIITKNWFGYPFSLAAGSLLFLIAFMSYKNGRISPGWAFIWGLTAGFTLYELPISLPFVLFSYLIILSIPLRTSSLSPKALFNNLWKSGAILCVIFTFLFLFPYWGPFFYKNEASSLQFLKEGRTLPPPRVAGENSLIDRFLGECLPTLLGIRAPYDQQNTLNSVRFPHIPVLLFLLSLIIYPFCSKKCSKDGVIQDRFIYFALYFFTLLTIILVTYSPFGIWPWYAIALFWIIPVLFYIVLRTLWHYSSGLSLITFLLLFTSIFSPFFSYSSAFHQPLSLSNEGLKTPINYNVIINALNENNIRYLICDQGYDVSPDHAGRDWLGETISYHSGCQVLSFDTMSRRLPFMAQEIVSHDDTAYLFHQNFYYNNPSLGEKRDYSPLTIKHLKSLFGEDFLGYKIIDCKPYILFLPPKENLRNPKSELDFHSTVFWFFRAINDHNLSVRSYGRESYWSTGEIPESGTFLEIKLDNPQKLNKLILFHGTKTGDRTPENQVHGLDREGERIFLGSLVYYPEINSSVLHVASQRVFKEIIITVENPEENHWWTIFELWVF